VPYVSTTVGQVTTGDCDVQAVGVASAQCQAMTAGNCYRFISTTNCWIRFGAAPTAAAGADGNVYLPANWEFFAMCQGTALKCAVIRDTADGFLSQTRVDSM
jgi:hypothetical protein